MLDKIYSFIYLHFFRWQCLVPRRGKLFCSCPTAWPSKRQREKSAQIKSLSVLAVRDLGTGLVFSHCLKTLCAGALLFNKNKFAP